MYTESMTEALRLRTQYKKKIRIASLSINNREKVLLYTYKLHQVNKLIDKLLG